MSVSNGRLRDLTGQRFGRLEVIKLDHMDDHGTSHWLCHCDCGKDKVISRTSLLRGTVSCGCYAREQSSKRHRKHGGHGTLLYSVWNAMKHRCSCPDDKGYRNYGGRGIYVCKEWFEDFTTFKNWAEASGYVEGSGLTIDRIDVNGPYCPENCRWVSMSVQANNRRTSKLVTYNGVSMTVTEWAKELEVDPRILRRRLIKYNFDLEAACASPIPTFVPPPPKPRRHRPANSSREWGISPLYKLWWRVKKSCCDPKHERYASYGAKGITICDEWKDSFHAFQEWSLLNGYKEKQGLVLHRIDPAGPYSPDNCKWVSRSENTTIRSRQVQLTYKGRTQNLTQWADELGISPTTLMYRIGQYNGDIAKAIEHKRGTRVC